jgi:DNA-binding transcriptional LysR family regulator
MNNRLSASSDRSSAETAEVASPLFSTDRLTGHNLTIGNLRSFAAVADTGSFPLAARRLGISPATVAAGLRTLETRLDARLIERGPPLTPTKLGQAFLVIARRLLDEVARTEADAARIARNQRGSVRLTAWASAMPLFLGDLLAAFRAAEPSVDVLPIDLDGQDGAAMLRAGIVDLALMPLTSDAARLETRQIGVTRVVALLPRDHLLARQPTIAWSQILAEPLFAMAISGRMGGITEQALLAWGHPIAHVERVSQAITLAGIVRARLGIGLLGSPTAQSIADPELAIRPLVEPEVARPLVVARLAGVRQPPSVGRLFDTIATAPLPMLR